MSPFFDFPLFFVRKIKILNRKSYETTFVKVHIDNSTHCAISKKN